MRSSISFDAALDVDLAGGDAERLHQRVGAVVGVPAGGEPGHGVAEDVPARQASRSKARTATSAACVESRPPETPITTFSRPVAVRRFIRPSTWML